MLTSDEAAEILNIPAEVVRLWAEEERIPHVVRPDGRIAIPLAALLAWADLPPGSAPLRRARSGTPPDPVPGPTGGSFRLRARIAAPIARALAVGLPFQRGPRLPAHAVVRA